MAKRNNTIKRWVAVGTLISGLSVANGLYAADSATCNSTVGDACCNTTVNSLCKIDNDINTGFQNITKTITDLFSATTDFTNKFLKGLITTANTSTAYIDNDAMNQSTASATNADLTTLMSNTPKDQLALTKKFAAQLPVLDSNFNVGNFSASTLMNNPGLTSDQSATAKQMIQNVANLGNPVKNIDKSLAQQTSLVPVQEFLGSMTAYSAAQSNGLNALYRVLQERTIKSGLGSTAGLSQEISPWQLDEYNVYQAMNIGKSGALDNATITDLARASYYALAGIQYEMFKNRQELQQLNVTMAIIQLQMLNSVNKDSLNKLRDQATN